MLFVVLSFSSVQTWLAHKFASYLSDELRTEVHIGKVKLTWSLEIELDDVYINDRHYQSMIKAGKIYLDIQSISIGKKKLNIKQLSVDELSISVVKYLSDNTFNIKVLSDYFSSSDTSKQKPWQINCKAISLNNSSFLLQDKHLQIIPDSKAVDYNNLFLHQINTTISDVSYGTDSVHALIQFLSLKERSGFTLVSLHSDFLLNQSGIYLNFLKLSTQNSFYSGSLALKYSNPNDFSDFLNKISLQAHIDYASLNLKDVAYFTKELWGMEDKIALEGNISGPISRLKLTDLKLRYGKSTFFSGRVQLTGLPNIEETFINLRVKEFFTSMYDIDRFRLPGVNQTISKMIPPQLLNFGNILVDANFTGFYNDFVAYGNFNTDAGNFKTDISLKRDKHNGIISYSGKLEANKVQAGKLLGEEEKFGTLSFNLNLSGSGLSEKDAYIKFDGTIDSLNFNQYCYHHFDIDGELNQKVFNGNIKLNDPNADLFFNGNIDFKEKIPVFNFNALLQNAHLEKLHLINRDSNLVLNTQLRCNFTGDKPDNLIGNLEFFNTSYKENGKTYFMKKLSVNSTLEADSSKTFQLRSDFVDADFKGVFIFKDLISSVEHFINGYIPSFLTEKSNSLQALTNEHLNFSISFKNTDDLCRLFIPNLTIAPHTELSGKFNSMNSNFSFNLESKYIKFNNYLVSNLHINGNTLTDGFLLKTLGESVYVNKNELFDSLQITTLVKTDSVRFSVNWTDMDTVDRNVGNINGNVVFPSSGLYVVNLNHTSITLKDSVWVTNNDNFISIDSNAIVLNNLKFSHNLQQLSLFGEITHDPTKSLKVSFSNFDLSDFDKVISQESVDLDGTMNGTLDIYKLYQTPEYISNLVVKNFGFNGDRLGDAIINSKWDNEKKAIFANMEIIYMGNYSENKPIKVQGYFYPTAEKENFDFDIFLENFKLKAIQHYVRAFSSSLVGKASGKLHLGGKTSMPELTGKVMLQRTIMKIDYSNTEYNFADEISFSPNSINFNKITVSDDYGNKAIVNGKLMHKGFTNFSIDLTIEPQKFLALNTNSALNANFYGKVFASGKLRISGPVEDLMIEATAAPAKGSLLVIPVGSQGSLKENNFITFVSKQVQVNIDSEYINTSDISLFFDLLVNQEATIQINFDPQSGGTLKANGDGDIKIYVPKKGQFQMSGEYVINDGDYYFNLQNIINKRFKIEKGGSIKWNGDPYDADINIRAKYRTKVSLGDIAKGEDSSAYSKRIPLESVLALSGKLSNPTIKFGFELPNSDNTVKAFVFDAIDTTNEQEMLRQTFSLLVMNRFMPTVNSKSSNTLSSGVEVTSTELISTQLSNWLSQISKDFDIGVKYQSGDKLSNEELQVALSTQLFNDRVIVDGNVGFGGGTTYTQPGKQSTSQIVGDVQVEVKITQDGRFRVLVFNRSNNNLLNYNTSLYTQGVGLFYRREFNKLSELFRKSQK
ncbi:MAG: translocation/assembly module TamB domain-containing protein [Bacteroidota bacterium]